MIKELRLNSGGESHWNDFPINFIKTLYIQALKMILPLLPVTCHCCLSLSPKHVRLDNIEKGAKKGRKAKKSVEGHIRGGRRRKEWQRGRRKKGKGKGEEKRERELLSLCPGTPLPLPFFTLPFQPLPCRLCEGDKPCKVNSLSPSWRHPQTTSVKQAEKDVVLFSWSLLSYFCSTTQLSKHGGNKLLCSCQSPVRWKWVQCAKIRIWIRHILSSPKPWGYWRVPL